MGDDFKVIGDATPENGVAEVEKTKAYKSRKRTNMQRERDRKEAAHWYLQGWTYKQIAEEFNSDPERPYKLSLRAIGEDLYTVRQRWLEASKRDVAEVKGRELAKLDKLEAEAWEAWNRSCESRNTTKLEGPATPQANPYKRTTTVKDSPGDPRFLTIIHECIARRCKMLGIDEPQQIESDVTLQIKVTRQVAPDELPYVPSPGITPNEIIELTGYQVDDAS